MGRRGIGFVPFVRRMNLLACLPAEPGHMSLGDSAGAACVLADTLIGEGKTEREAWSSAVNGRVAFILNFDDGIQVLHLAACLWWSRQGRSMGIRAVCGVQDSRIAAEDIFSCEQARLPDAPLSCRICFPPLLHPIDEHHQVWEVHTRGSQEEWGGYRAVDLVTSVSHISRHVRAASQRSWWKTRSRSSADLCSAMEGVCGHIIAVSTYVQRDLLDSDYVLDKGRELGHSLSEQAGIHFMACSGRRLYTP